MNAIKSKKAIIIAIVSVLLVAIIVCGIIFIPKLVNKDEKKSETEIAPCTPVFLPGDSQGRRSLVGYCLWDRTESDTTEVT